MKLKAKAAMMRKLMNFTADLASEMKHRDGELGIHRAEAMGLLQSICELGAKYDLTDQELMQWRWMASQYFYHHAMCGFRTYPKHHYFLHLPGQIQRSGSPRNFWVYSEESKNAYVKRVFNMCSKGWKVDRQLLLRFSWQHALQGL